MRLAILLIPLLASCTANQVYMERPDGSVRLAYNGGSVGTKAATDTATMSFGNVTMTRTVTVKDEVEGAATIARLGLTKMAISKSIDAGEKVTVEGIRAIK